MSEARDESRDLHDRIDAGRAFLRGQRLEAALIEFDAAYDAAVAERAMASPDADSAGLHDFVSAAYWRSAVYNQLRMKREAEQQTYELLSLVTEGQAGLTAAEHGLIYYARGRYYLEFGGFHDAISCFDSALTWDVALERAIRDRIRVYRATDWSHALYYAMEAVRALPDSRDVRVEYMNALLDARLWAQAEGEAREFLANYPGGQSVGLVLLARAQRRASSRAFMYSTRTSRLSGRARTASIA